MWKKELCLGLSAGFGLPALEQMKVMREIGFEAFFSDEGSGFPEQPQELARAARALGLRYQSVHAPYLAAADMWHGSREAARAGLEQLLTTLEKCARAEVTIMVAHAYIGFGESPGPTAQGLEHYGEAVERARELGIQIAFENTEGEEYLAALLDAFRESPAVGFCWDSGHEMCYNHSRDLLALYGDRLIATHLNDNLGIRALDGTTIWTDDLHLLPFDGIADWDCNVHRLKQTGFDGPLTFELGRKSKPGRHENDGYGMMEPVVYLTEVYKRACRVAAKFYR